MKKIIVLIIGLFLVIPITTKAATIDWTLDREVFVHRIINGKYHLTNMPYLTVDNNIAYCIEPGLDLEKNGTMTPTFNINDTSVKKSIKRASIIGYYGYKKFGHDDKKYYMAAQKLIWLEMGAESVKYTYDREGNNLIDISKYENDILNEVNNYDKTPIFDIKDKYMVGDTVKLKSKNMKLDGYELYSPSNTISMNKDGVTIKIQDNNKNTFKLVKKNDNTKTVFYYKSGLQTVATFGVPYEVNKSYDLNYTYGSIKVKKYDSDLKIASSFNSYTSIKGAVYGIYDEDNNLLFKGETDSNGEIIFNNLKKGTYKIKEIKPSLGYNIDNKEYIVKLDSNNIKGEVISYEKVIEGNVEITKLFNNKEKNTLDNEEGILFGIYTKDDMLVKQGVTDKNGKITFTLPYGKYIIKQLSTKPNVDMVDDINIEINEEGKMLKYRLINNKIEDELPKTGKNLYDTLILVGVIFGLLIYEKKFS